MSSILMRNLSCAMDQHYGDVEEEGYNWDVAQPSFV